jgi:hypothetical protein
MLKQAMKLVLLPAAAAVLVACGGGGGGGSTASSPLNISGTAAMGAPLAGANVKVYDATGTIVVSDGVVQPNGSYNVTIPAGKQGPFVFVADDGDQTYASVLSDTSKTTVNITPLSNLLAATFSASGNPANLVSEIVSKTADINATNYATKVEALRTAISPVLTAVGVTAGTFDPVNSAFSANGAGIDKVLDVLDVSITPSTATSSNIELTVKVSLNEDDVNPNNSLKFNTAAGFSGALPSITPADLPPDGTSVLIQELLNKLTACYSVPLANRIATNGTAAGDITAPACREAFINSDPDLYLSSGSKVGKTGHFGGIFTATVPVTFERPKFFGAVRTSQANGPQAGDMLIGFRWKDDFGNFQYERSMVRKTNTTPAKLEIVGNGYLYDSAVTPYAQLRQFVRDNDRDYYSVGYSPFVARRLYTKADGSTKSISSVKVTTGTGREILLCNDPNYSFLVMAKPAVTPTCADKTGTAFIRLRSEYANKATTADNHPRLKDTGVAFVATDWTDDEIEAVKTYAAWKYEFTLRDTVTNVISTAVQWHRPTRRVHSVREFKKVPLPTVTPTMLASMRANVVSSLIRIPADGVSVSWQKSYSTVNGIVPEDAVPMTAIRIFGRYTTDSFATYRSFEDRMIVRSNASQATIKCPSTSPLEAQCSSAGVYKSSAGVGSAYTGLDLWSRGADGVEYVNFYATYMINP